MIPVDRRASEKEENWTLAKECEDSTAQSSDTKDPKPKIENEQKDTEKCSQKSVDDKSSETDATITRGHETRKSKARRVKSYLKKCKGALSKSEDNSVERKRENCSSWYLKESSDSSSKPDISELVTTDDDLEEAISSVPHEVEINKQEALDVHDSENLQKGLDESKNDFDKGSKGSLYEDASDIAVHETREEKTTTRDPDNLVEGPPTKKETEIQDNIMNKCDSSDTLIADVPEVLKTTINIEVEVSSISKSEIDVLGFNKNHQESSGSEEVTGLPTALNFGVSQVYNTS